MSLVSQFKVTPASGSGPCPSCHQPRAVRGCHTWWDMTLREGKWQGTLFVVCNGFPRDREQLAEHLNAYHVRPELGGGHKASHSSIEERDTSRPGSSS